MISLSPGAAHWLIDSAYDAIEHYIDTKSMRVFDIERVPEEFREELSTRSGVFVSIFRTNNQNKQEFLRGQNGSREALDSLWRSVPITALNAGFFDHKTPRLKPYELNEIKVSVQIPHEYKYDYLLPDELLGHINETKNGVVASYRGRFSYLLPHMWNEYDDAEQILRVLLLQLGLKASQIWDPEIDYSILTLQTLG